MLLGKSLNFLVLNFQNGYLNYLPYLYFIRFLEKSKEVSDYTVKSTTKGTPLGVQWLRNAFHVMGQLESPHALGPMTHN